MRAIHVTAIGGPDVLQPVELPEPEVAPGTVRIRNRAVAINFHDVQSRRSGEDGLEVPFVPGTDFAGEVDAVGEGVSGIAAGDRILGISTHGAYAEASIVPAALAMPIPDDVSFEQAASCPVAGLTAWFLLEDNAVGADTAVVAHAAAGSVGCFLGGLLRERGARSIGLVSTDAKTDIARRTGFEHAIVYTREDPVARVKELTDGQGAQLVLDSVAGPRFARSFDMAAPGGTVVLFGRAAGDPPREALEDAFLGAGRNLGLRTYFLGTTIATRLARIRPAYEQLFAAWRRGAIQVPIETVPLEKAADAHARIESQQTTGKVILIP